MYLLHSLSEDCMAGIPGTVYSTKVASARGSASRVNGLSGAMIDGTDLKI